MKCYITKPKILKSWWGVVIGMLLHIFSFHIFLSCPHGCNLYLFSKNPVLFPFDYKGSTFSHLPYSSKMVRTREWLRKNLRKKIPLSVRELARKYFHNQKWKSGEIMSRWNWWLKKKPFWNCYGCYLLPHQL